MLRIARDEPALFASDMHLSAQSPGTAARFLAELDRHGPSAAHLFLLGDLFEMWVGDDVGDPLADALADIAARFTKAADAAGEVALFQVAAIGDHYLFVSDGKKGLGANDLLIQLVGVDEVSAIDLTQGRFALG